LNFIISELVPLIDINRSKARANRECLICRKHLLHDKAKPAKDINEAKLWTLIYQGLGLKYRASTLSNYICDDCWWKWDIETLIEDGHSKTSNGRAAQQFRDRKGHPLVNLRLLNRLSIEERVRLQFMAPEDLYKSTYWFHLRSAVIYLRGGVCALCGTDYSLQLHHNTYKFRGWEDMNLNCLTLLCNTHHEKYADLVRGESGNPGQLFDTEQYLSFSAKPPRRHN
jgi:hypothetical protein